MKIQATLFSQFGEEQRAAAPPESARRAQGRGRAPAERPADRRTPPAS